MMKLNDNLFMSDFILSIAFFISVGALFSMHTYLLLVNASTIELKVLNRKNIYNKGHYENWI